MVFNVAPKACLSVATSDVLQSIADHCSQLVLPGIVQYMCMCFGLFGTACCSISAEIILGLNCAELIQGG